MNIIYMIELYMNIMLTFTCQKRLYTLTRVFSTTFGSRDFQVFPGPARGSGHGLPNRVHGSALAGCAVY